MPTLEKCERPLARKASDLWRECAIFDKRVLFHLQATWTFPLIPAELSLSPVVHTFIAELRKWESSTHDTTPGLRGRLVVSRGNCTRRRCMELQASRSSSHPVDRRGSPVRRVSITLDTPRWMDMAGRPTPRGSDKGRPSLDRLDDPRKVGLPRWFFINKRARLFMRKHKHGQVVRIGVAKKPVHTHFRKHGTV